MVGMSISVAKWHQPIGKGTGMQHLHVGEEMIFSCFRATKTVWQTICAKS